MSSPSLARTIDTYLISWQRENWPLNWEDVFGRKAPLHLELGFGNGEFLRRSALDHPEVNWVGVEISWGSIKRLLKRLEDGRIDNVRVLQGDGAGILRRLFADRSLHEVVINHSDPWPKKRHHRRRLIQASFLDTLTHRLVFGGRIVIVTDHDDYAAWIEDHLARKEGLRSVFPTPWVDTLPDHGPTKYKLKGVEAGSTIHHFVWQKVTKRGAGTRPICEVPEMPNVLLDGTCEFETLFSSFESCSWKTERGNESVLLQLGSAYLRRDGKEWLIEARSQEDDFVQRFAIVAAPRPESRVLFKLSPLGTPRPTWGVKKCLEALVEWTLERNPGLVVHPSTPPEATPPPN